LRERVLRVISSWSRRTGLGKPASEFMLCWSSDPHRNRQPTLTRLFPAFLFQTRFARRRIPNPLQIPPRGDPFGQRQRGFVGQAGRSCFGHQGHRAWYAGEQGGEGLGLGRVDTGATWQIHQKVYIVEKVTRKTYMSSTCVRKL